MLTFLFSFNLALSIMFMFMLHPLSMGLILLIQTITISLITGKFNLNFWFSYILFLILIGGMLIMFIYMTSIASNEKFKNNILIAFPLIIIPINMWMFNYPLNINNFMENSNFSFNLSMIKYLNFPHFFLMTFLIIYLLLTLIAVVKITNFKQGPLRQKN